MHTDSSVIEVAHTFWPASMQRLLGKRAGESVRGQAVFLDLQAHGLLVAALYGFGYDSCNEDARYLVGRAYESSTSRRRCFTGYPLSLENERALAQKRGRVDLTPDNLPHFFWFSDSKNLATARPIEPKDFASIIGDSTRLFSAQIEITRDPVVFDIEKKLPACAPPNWPLKNGPRSAPNDLITRCQLFISRR